MYNYTNAPWKTQEQARKILSEEYSDGPGGLSGNDDAGQMSAWYVFSAMGFYPVNPVSTEYALCSPLFDKIKLKVNQEKTLEIITHKQSRNSIFIHRSTWNGKPFNKYFITQKMIVGGGKLELWLVDQTIK
jgi:putative alpha-1,2-mannosidase